MLVDASEATSDAFESADTAEVADMADAACDD